MASPVNYEFVDKVQEDHQCEKCLFMEVSCAKKCGERMLQKNLQDHENTKCPNRQVKCQHCRSKGRYKYISSKQHIKGCSGYPLPCPNSCGQKDIKRKYIEAHRQVLVECSFSEAGCGDVPRQDLEAHLASDTKQHLALVMTTMTTTKKHLTEKMQVMHRNFNTMASRVTRELDAISSSSHSLKIDSIKTTLALVTTMLETGTKYCLRMTNTISSLKHHSESFLVKLATRCRFTTQISVNLMYQRVYTWKEEKTMIN